MSPDPKRHRQGWLFSSCVLFFSLPPFFHSPPPLDERHSYDKEQVRRVVTKIEVPIQIFCTNKGKLIESIQPSHWATYSHSQIFCADKGLKLVESVQSPLGPIQAWWQAASYQSVVTSGLSEADPASLHLGCICNCSVFTPGLLVSPYICPYLAVL